MRKFKKLGRWDIKRHASNDYIKNVTDDPILLRKHTYTDIERRISHALNKIEDLSRLPTLDSITACYRTSFTRRGQEYYILIKLNKEPVPVVAVWTEEIYQNYLNGITSNGDNIFERYSIDVS